MLYFHDVGQQLSLVVVHELGFLLDDHFEVGGNQLELLPEELLL